MRRVEYVLYMILMVLSVSGVQQMSAQTADADSLVRLGDSLRERYRFEESVSAYMDAMGMETDSLRRSAIEDRVSLSENGIALSELVYKPVVIERHKFSIDDFFLYYPLRDSSWRAVPNQLDTASFHPLAKAMYVKDDDDVIYYSAEDSEGVRNIYKTELQEDGIWSLPSLLNEQMTSTNDEIYPLVSADGNSMYFSSAGLYGVGGYDIYVSVRDEETGDWSEPSNLGFPYSSPADDFLFLDTEDGVYTIFASNRDCSPDSVWVYVLEYETMPVRKEISDPDELLELSHLYPSAMLQRMEESSHVPAASESDNPDTQRYMELSSDIRDLQDSLYLYDTLLADGRERLAMSTSNEEQSAVMADLQKLEIRLFEIRRQLEEASAQMEQLNNDFFNSGVIIDYDTLLEEAEREVVGEATSYVFAKMSMGTPLEMTIADPPPTFDYSFKVLPEGQFAEDNTIPPGVVYQIQIFNRSTPAAVKDLRGLSPVFEVRPSNGSYTYRVGLFSSYNDVLSSLNTVKKAGFRTAYIVAYIDGQEVKVSAARAKEAEIQKAREEMSYLYEVRVYPAGGEMDPVMLEGLVQQSSGKDVARSEDEEGRAMYVVGPYTEHAAAQALADFAGAMGMGEVVLHKMPKTLD